MLNGGQWSIFVSGRQQTLTWRQTEGRVSPRNGILWRRGQGRKAVQAVCRAEQITNLDTGGVHARGASNGKRVREVVSPGRIRR